MKDKLVPQKSDIADLILLLEKCLREYNLWQLDMPSHDDLMSTEPFSCDTLNLTEWLQWVFIPKMKQVIESNAVLPQGSNITAYAEEALKGVDFPAGDLLNIIRQLDQSMS